MARSSHIKIGVLVLALSMVCAGVILLGNTFATKVNKTDHQVIVDENNKTMKYDIDLLYVKDTTSTSLLTSNAAVFTENMLWCPGKTEVVHLQLVNNEKFPVEYRLFLDVTESEFESTLTYAILADDHDPTSWTDFVNHSNGKRTLSKERHLLTPTELTLASKGTYNLTFAIHMEESATSEYRNKQLEFVFDIEIDADQDGTRSASSSDND